MASAPTLSQTKSNFLLINRTTEYGLGLEVLLSGALFEGVNIFMLWLYFRDLHLLFGMRKGVLVAWRIAPVCVGDFRLALSHKVFKMKEIT